MRGGVGVRGRGALGRSALGRAALGRAALGRAALGRAALVRAAVRRGAPLLGLVIAASGVLAVGGCGSDPEPPPATNTTPTPTPTPTPAPTVTPMAMPVAPDVRQGTDDAAALAAARYFMELYEYVYATGDLTAWDAASGQTCVYCQNVHNSVTEIYDAGGRFTADAPSVYEGFTVLGRDEQLGYFGIELRYALAAGRVEDSSGVVISTDQSEAGTLVIEVHPSVSGWLLLGARATIDGDE